MGMEGLGPQDGTGMAGDPGKDAKTREPRMASEILVWPWWRVGLGTQV